MTKNAESRDSPGTSLTKQAPTNTSVVGGDSDFYSCHIILSKMCNFQLKKWEMQRTKKYGPYVGIAINRNCFWAWGSQYVGLIRPSC